MFGNVAHLTSQRVSAYMAVVDTSEGGFGVNVGAESLTGRARATIEDVAAAAGVSVATVSRALRGLPGVAAPTRERVASVAEQMSYRADPAASRLAMGKSRSIAVAVPLLNGWYFSQIVAGAEAICALTGYDMIVVGLYGDAARQSFIDAGDSIHRRVDGVIFVEIPLSENDVSDLIARGLRTVTIGQATHRFPSVGIDDTYVGELATSHLLSLGHTRIGLIGDQPAKTDGRVVPALRQTGYAHALGRAGIALDPKLQVSGSFTMVGGLAAMETLLELADPPTAVFAMSDEMAFGALVAMKQRGLSAPKDVSILGVDDHDLSELVGLTTVRQIASDHGSRAARLLISQLEGNASTVARYDGVVELISRESTARA